MWSPRSGALGALGRRVVAALLVGAVASVLGGCVVRPLYATLPGGAAPASVTELAAIDVAAPETRVEQVFRNELSFLLTPNGAAPLSRYGLRYIITPVVEPLAVQKLEGQPSAVLVRLDETFILTDRTSGLTLLTGSTFATASYDYSSQRYADLRAQRDAENRAAKTLAENVENRLATFFAARQLL